MRRTIYLVRHGMLRLPDNEKRYIGQIDLPLSEEGIAQAIRLQERLAAEQITQIFCSDLLRTKQTAEIIASFRNINIAQRRDLREIYLGEWEGRTFSEIEQEFPTEFKARGEDILNYSVPGGESFLECGERVIAGFYDILKSSHGDILIVGHAGVNRLILCHLLGIPANNLFSITQSYGCLNIIKGIDDGSLRAFNKYRRSYR